MKDLTFHDSVFDTELEGHVVAEVKLRFLPIKEFTSDKERMTYDRISVRLDQLAKQAELQLEEQVNAEFLGLRGVKTNE